eukprot:PhM_4_TR10413/c0_g1_i2/m.22336
MKRSREGSCDRNSVVSSENEAVTDAFERLVLPALTAAFAELKGDSKSDPVQEQDALIQKCVDFGTRATCARVQEEDDFVELLRHRAVAIFRPDKAPKEQTLTPKNHEGEMTVAVDAFLYDNDDVDVMCDHGKLPRHYCRKCGSAEHIELVNYVSHSFSPDQLRYVFGVALKKLLAGRNGVRLVDVGSRLGIVLCCAAHYLGDSATSITGVEMNKDFVEFSQSLVRLTFPSRDQKDLVNKITVECKDALSEDALETMHGADVLIMNNVFEWFSDEAGHKAAWEYVRTTVATRAGQLLVCVPSLEESFKSCGLKFPKKWVQHIDTDEGSFESTM